MTRIGTEIGDDVEQLWEEARRAAEQKLGLICGAPPERTVVVPDETYDGRPGGVLCDSTMLLAESTVSGKIPLKGVVFRECVMTALPQDGVCEECIDDIATEFARQELEGEARERWLTQWKGYRPLKRVTSTLHYDPTLTFPALFSMVGPEALQTIVRDIVQVIVKNRGRLTIQEYLQYLSTRSHGFSVTISMTDLRIASELLKRPTITNQSIARATGKTPQWVSSRIAYLRQRQILRKFNIVRFSKIGIRMFHLVVEAAEDQANPAFLLEKCPFVYSCSNLLTGSRGVYAVLAVPDNRDSVAAVEQFIGAAPRDWGVRTFLTEVISSGSQFCFDYYDPEKRCWDIPWDMERVHAARIYRDNLADIIPRQEETREQVCRHFDDLDMRILDCVWRGVASVARIRRALHVGQHRVAERLKRLREDGVVVTRWEVHNIGLVERVLVQTHDKEVGEAIAAWAQRLPRSIVSFDLSGYMTMVASLPVGGAYGISWALSLIPMPITIRCLEPPVYGRWGFPTQLWDSTTHRWMAPSEAIAKWFDAVR